MARYHDTAPELERQQAPRYEYLDSHQSPAVSIIAPAYDRIGVDYRDTNHSSMVRASQGHSHRHAASVVEEPVVEHEHHHLHHHIDHGDFSGRSIALSRNTQRPMQMERQYSYDDLDVKERRYMNGTAVTTIHRSHEHEQPRQHRHRRRHRSRHGSQTRISRSEVDLTLMSRHDQERDDVTVVDVPAGSRRIYVNVENPAAPPPREREREREREHKHSVDWRREHGIRRSRGLGNELWTEITKDLVTREAIEDLGFPYEETEFFYYIFEYLDSQQLNELRQLTDDIRHARVRDLEYESIAGSQRGHSPVTYPEHDFDDSRTEIIIEHGGGRDHGRRRRYYN